MVLSTNDFLEMNNPLTTTNIQEGSEEPKNIYKPIRQKEKQHDKSTRTTTL